MTTASPAATVSSNQFGSASSHVDYDTPVAEAETTAAAAAAPTDLPPPQSTEDPHEDECVLCCYPFPFEPSDSVYKACCGEVICHGCIIAQQRTLIIGTNVKKPIAGSKEEELEFKKILSSKQIIVCPFCRAKAPRNTKECLKRLWERIDEYNDPKAINQLGDHYMKGECGVSKNRKKAEELFQRSYDLGNLSAAFNLFVLYSEHITDQARMIQYVEEAARQGNLHCMNILGIRAAESDNQEEAKRQFMTTACSGDEMAMQNLMKLYRKKWLSKDDLATTLRTHKAAHDKGKSEPREYAIRFKAFKEKMITTGKMKEVRIKDKRK